MTAPTTLTATGTWYHPDGTLASGFVNFSLTNPRIKNTNNIIVREVTTANLSSGAISQTLVQDSGGYDWTAFITGLDGQVRQHGPFHMAATGNINITT